MRITAATVMGRVQEVETAWVEVVSKSFNGVDDFPVMTTPPALPPLSDRQMMCPLANRQNPAVTAQCFGRDGFGR